MHPLPDHRPGFPPEDALAALLGTLQQDAPPPDRAFLAQLRDKSAEAFHASARPIAFSYRRSAVLSQTTRFAAVAASLLILAVLSLLPRLMPHTTRAAFQSVVQRLSEADSLHLRLTHNGQTSDVWAIPGKLRLDAGDGRYQIVKGRQSWRIDERENRVTPGDLALFSGPGQHLDLLRLLGLPPEVADKLQVEPGSEERVWQNGQEYITYRLKAQLSQGIVRLDAWVTPVSKQLHRLQAGLEQQGRITQVTELAVLTLNAPVADELFIVSDTLTEDGRVGKVLDVQGCVTLRPMTAERWTPIGRNVLLRSGDWLRTDLRGANAVAFQLMKNTKVILGPGSLVEIEKPAQFKLISGEMEITVPAGETVEVIGPTGQKTTVQGKKQFRAQPLLAELTAEPRWLKGFKGVTTTESLGSLIAQVDGRNVELTVGYHKVTVDIRDQIARTTIEESFVNRTRQRLEGVFHFPLPQDASISGFGMWIGDQYVEADVVEKQRAREIYEIIKSEKRDPGLLEWSGGNIFTARIFPIEPLSEKRIKITYTQVLPLKGNRFTYSYALQSELLQQYPLKQLELKVNLHSVQPLKSITCPTHPTRNQQTANAASVEFTAQEYTPKRDFEVVVELEQKRADVVTIPHRRGNDGYFMVQLTPPAPSGDWQRETLNGAEPLQLLILADTSASMDKAQRENQAQVLAAIFAALTPRDSINLATCDVACDWVFAKPISATSDNLQAARQFLDKRVSLGWTDLDKAFASAMQQTQPTTHVIYLGDGINTTGDADPTAFAQRLKRQYGGKGTFHAIALGSSHESGVLKAIASLGGGSMRKVSGEQTTQIVALDLLKEIAQPGLRNLKVEFRGLRTARVYPETLPNLPAGSQHILLGRYLPEGKDQVGEIIVTATQGGRPVRFSSPVYLTDAEQGNSFIPRLWARQHLDSLLDLGVSSSSPLLRGGATRVTTGSEIKDEIIALSEEFQIITPYTSLLVLETDADRERFKVKRQFRMRDGEKYFAEGKDSAAFALKQQQMKRAGTWRLGLERQMQAELVRMGRDTNLSQPPWTLEQMLEAQVFDPTVGQFLSSGRHGGPRLLDQGEELYDQENRLDLSFAGGGTGGRIQNLGVGRGSTRELLGKEAYAFNMPSDSSMQLAAPLPTGMPAPGNVRFIGNTVERMERSEAKAEAASEGADLRGIADPSEPTSKNTVVGLTPAHTFTEGLDIPINQGSFSSLEGQILAQRGFYDVDGRSLEQGFGIRTPRQLWADDMGRTLDSNGEVLFSRRNMQAVPFLTLFPYLPHGAQPKKPIKSKWSPEASKLATSLVRKDALLKLEGGLEIVRQTEAFEPRWNDLVAQARTTELYSPKQWLTRAEGDGWLTMVNWCDGQQRGVFAPVLGTGRVRSSQPIDLETPQLALGDGSLASLEESYPGYEPTVQAKGDKQALLILRHEDNPDHEIRYLIDTEKHVLLEVETQHKGKVTQRVRFRNFVQVADSWWALERENFNDKNQLTVRSQQTIRAVAAPVFMQRMQQELAGKEQILFLHLPFPTVAMAQEQIAAGKGTLDHHFRLLLHFAQSQQWKQVREQLQAIQRLAPSKPALAWLKREEMLFGRQHEELRQDTLLEAKRLAEKPAQDDLWQASYLFQRTRQVLAFSEALKLLDALQPVFARQPAHRDALKGWMLTRQSLLLSVGRNQEANALRREMATKYPKDAYIQMHFAAWLALAEDYDGAYAHLRKLLALDYWLPGEADQFHNLYVQLLQRQGRLTEMAAYLSSWLLRQPETSYPYQTYLQVLLWTNQMEKYYATVMQWLKEAQVPGELPMAVRQRLRVAMHHALGDGFRHDLALERRWRQPLAEAWLYHLPFEDRLEFVYRLHSHWRFQNTDEYRQMQPRVQQWIKDNLATVKASHAVQLVHMLTQHHVSADEAKRLAQTLRERWQAETRATDRHVIGNALVTLLSAYGLTDDLLAFQRLQMTQGPEVHRPAYTSQYLETLVSRPWKADHEEEVFRLLPQTLTAQEPGERLRQWVQALYRMNDRLLSGRQQAEENNRKGAKELTRSEQEARAKEIRQIALRGLIERLRTEEKRQPPEFTPWLAVERLYLQAQLEQDQKETVKEAWTVLQSQPAELLQEAADVPVEKLLRRVWQHRLRLTLGWLAIRKGADPEWPGQLLKHLDALAATAPQHVYPRQLRFQLLVALDRPKELLQVLQQWLGEGKPAPAPSTPSQGGETLRWQFALAYLQAELGDIPAAIAGFEQLEQTNLLQAGDYAVLADWYLVANRKDKHDRAKVRIYEVIQEGALNNVLYHHLQRVQPREGQTPSELDPEVPKMFVALLRKSSNPLHYVSLLTQFYQAVPDFRLLEALADGMIGHTAERVYPLLGCLHQIMVELREEATADQLLQKIAALRVGERTTTDLRALDILEMHVLRQASEVRNQPGQYGDAALKAMQRAFQRDWSEGEQLHMAQLLAQLGAIPLPALAEEQRRQLKTLLDLQKTGTAARLHVAHHYGQTLWTYTRRQEAIDVLHAAVEDFQGGRAELAQEATNVFASLINYLMQMKQHRRAEDMIQARLGAATNIGTKRWLRTQLYELYANALGDDVAVSLGQGETLFKALAPLLQKDLAANRGEMQQLLHLFCRLCTVAKEKKFASVTPILQTFADGTFPELLLGRTNEYPELVGAVANALHFVAGPRSALKFLLDRIEAEPRWLFLMGLDGWSRHSHNMAIWRREIGNIGALEPRLLKMVLTELRRDLETHQFRNRSIYDIRNNDYWPEKEQDFAQTAEAVWKENKKSAVTAEHVADYLYHGLKHRDRAIAILQEAHKAKLLNDEQLWKLVAFLHQSERYKETITLLQGLVQRQPDRLDYRTRLMRIYHQVKQHADLLALLKETDSLFLKGKRENEGVLLELGKVCLDCQLYEQAVSYLNDAIAVNLKKQGTRASHAPGEYYQPLALAHAGLRKTPEAVDAATSAIIAWGPKHQQRQAALNTLKTVLKQSPNLDAYASHWEQIVAKDGKDAAIVRKAIGQVYQERKAWAKAVRQFQAAVELQPGDREIHEALLESQHHAGDTVGMTATLLRMLDLYRRENKLYQKLGDHYAKLGTLGEAERAFTSMVEMQPKESESHQLLAEIRQKQNRWPDAIAHWRQVVQLRSLEPTGYLELTKAYIHEKRWDEAEATLKEMKGRTWHRRFGEVDKEVISLEKKVQEGRKGK
jgi:tetratricopeptide (TPR) repeat protein